MFNRGFLLNIFSHCCSLMANDFQVQIHGGKTQKNYCANVPGYKGPCSWWASLVENSNNHWCFENSNLIPLIGQALPHAVLPRCPCFKAVMYWHGNMSHFTLASYHRVGPIVIHVGKAQILFLHDCPVPRDSMPLGRTLDSASPLPLENLAMILKWHRGECLPAVKVLR